MTSLDDIREKATDLASATSEDLKAGAELAAEAVSNAVHKAVD